MTRSPKKICSRIGLALLAMMVVWLAGSMVVMPLLEYIMPDWQTNGIGVWLMNDIPLYLLGLPTFLLIIWGIPNGSEAPREKQRFHVGHFLLAFVFCLGAMYGLNMATSFITMLVDTLRGSQSVDNLAAMTANSSWVMNLLFGAVVPALGEEFVFRYMLRKKLRGAGDKIYIFFSAFCFGLFHGNLSQICYATAVGALLALVYTRTGNIWASVAIHFLVNSLGLVLVPALVEQGGDMAIGIMGLSMLLLAAAAAILLGVGYKRVSQGFAPPSEAGWPYKAPRAQQPWAMAPPYGGYPAVPYPPVYTQAQGAYPAAYPASPSYPQPGGYPGYPGSYPATPPPHPGPYPGQPSYDAYPAAHRPPPTRHSQAPYGQQPWPYAPPGAQPYAPPYAGMPYQQPPYQPPYGAPAYWGYPMAYQQPVYKQPGAVRLCLGNLGMILYMSLAGILTLTALFL